MVMLDQFIELDVIHIGTHWIARFSYLVLMIGQLEFGMLKTAKRNWFAIK
jgi:hypothetical protein